MSPPGNGDGAPAKRPRMNTTAAKLQVPPQGAPTRAVRQPHYAPQTLAHLHISRTDDRGGHACLSACGHRFDGPTFRVHAVDAPSVRYCAVCLEHLVRDTGVRCDRTRQRLAS